MAHRFTMPVEYVARTITRQGREHSIETIDATKTALLVVDMQNYFISTTYPAACPVAAEISSNVNRIAKRLRDAGGRIVWIQNRASTEREEWSSQHKRYLPERAKVRWDALQPDSDGFALWPEMELCDTDDHIVKSRYSPFAANASNLHSLLTSSGVTTLIVTGVATNACCESTARDAMMLNFDVVMVADACAAASDAEHAAALCNFYLYFGDVQTTDEIIDKIEG